jgi:hypothetical protein
MVPKKERSNLKNLELINTIKKFKINTSNSTPEAYNMTPESDSINNIKVQNKFDKTYMKGSGEIKTYNEGQPNIIGSSGAFGFIGGGGVKLLGKGIKALGRVLGFGSKPSKVIKPRYPSSRNLMKSSENVTPTGANPRSRIHGEHVSPKGETLGSYQYRSTGFGGGGRVWVPTRTDRPAVGKFEKMAAEYLKKAVKKGTATEAEKATWKIYNERISRPFLDL